MNPIVSTDITSQLHHESTSLSQTTLRHLVLPSFRGNSDWSLFMLQKNVLKSCSTTLFLFYKIIFYDLGIQKVQYLFWINLVKEKVKQIEHLSWQISLQNLCTRCKCNGETDIKQVLANLKMQNVPKRNAYIFFRGILNVFSQVDFSKSVPIDLCYVVL